MSGNDKKKSKKTMWIILIILIFVTVYFLNKKNENLTLSSCDTGSAPGCIKESTRLIIQNQLNVSNIINSTIYSRDMRDEYNTCISNFKTYFNNNISNFKNNKYHLITYETKYIVDGSTRSVIIVFFLNTENSKIYKISRCYFKSKKTPDTAYEVCDNLVIARIRYENQKIKDTGDNIEEVVDAYNVNSYYIDPDNKFIRINDNKYNLIAV